jgi:hypothetical protein
MDAPSLARASIDRSFYAVLKLHVFATVHEVFLRSFSGRNGHAVSDAKPTLGRFTARKADHLFVPRNGNALSCSADFLGFTSHKVREKLTQLEEDGVVHLEGRGLRDAYTYRWVAPLRLHELSSFMVLWKATQDDLSLNIELARIYDAAGQGTFGFQAFVKAYAEAHGDEYGGSRWGTRRFERLRNSSDYERFLKARLQKLLQRGLVSLVASEPATFTLTAKARDLVHHFNLFVDGVPYHPSRAMCQACPLFENCRVRGLVEPMLGALSGHLEAFPATHGLSVNGHANGNGHAPGPALVPTNGHGTMPLSANGHAPLAGTKGHAKAVNGNGHLPTPAAAAPAVALAPAMPAPPPDTPPSGRPPERPKP